MHAERNDKEFKGGLENKEEGDERKWGRGDQRPGKGIREQRKKATKAEGMGSQKR